MKVDLGLPLKHFALPLPPDPTIGQLHETYHTLYDGASKAVRLYIETQKGDLELHPSEGGSSPISYNLAMTTSGMAIVPRRREAAVLKDSTGKEIGSVALNGTILAGTMMVKLQEEWDLLKNDRNQLDRVLGTIGIPV